MTTESEILFPAGKQLKIGEEEITVSRMKLHQIIKSTGLLSGIFDLAYQLFQDNDLNIKSIMELFSTDGDNMLEFISIAIAKDRKFVNELELDDAVNVLTAILEVNMDFFVSKVMPMMNKRVENLKQFKSKT